MYERLMEGREWEWEAQTEAREGKRKRWSEDGVGSLNSGREGCTVIKEKAEIQEGNKRLGGGGRVCGRIEWWCI